MSVSRTTRQLRDDAGNPVPGTLDAIRWARDVVIPKPPSAKAPAPGKSARSELAPPVFKAALLVLASRANESLAVWTSPRKLGANIQVKDERRVRRIVDDLAELGLLAAAPTYRLSSGADSVNVYVLNADGWLDDIIGDTAALIARLKYLEDATDVSNRPRETAFKG